MAYQVMQDTEGDYYILCDKYTPSYTLIAWSEGMYQGIECSPDDLQELHACPELSPSKLAFEWVRKPCTWEALLILNPCLKAKLPGELPPLKEYIKKEFKLSETKSAISFSRHLQRTEMGAFPSP